MENYKFLKGEIMGLLTSVLLIAAHLALIFIDLLFFLSLVHLLCYKWQTRWLTILDSTGKPVRDWFVSHIQKGISQISSKTFPQRKLLMIGMFGLLLARFFLVALFSK